MPFPNCSGRASSLVRLPAISSRGVEDGHGHLPLVARPIGTESSAPGGSPRLQRASRALPSNLTRGDGTRRLGLSPLRGGVPHMRTGGCRAMPERSQIGGVSRLAPDPSPVWRPIPVRAGIARGCSQRQVSRETKRCSTGSRSWEAVCVSRTCPSVDLASGITQC